MAVVVNKEDLTRKRLTSKLFKGFADYTRLTIFEVLMDGEKTVTEIIETTGFNQSSVSNHLKCLRECELVNDRQEGKYVFYSIRDKNVQEIIRLANEIVQDITEERYRCMKF